MPILDRTFRNTQTGRSFSVTSDEEYLPPLRRRLVQELCCEADWENESIYEHQLGLDIKRDGDFPGLTITER